MRLNRPVDFDPEAELEEIARFAERWRSLFRPSEVAYTPEYFTQQIEKLQTADTLRLYLVTRPQRPIALAILDGLSQDEVMTLLSLSPLDEDGTVRPWLASPAQRFQMMEQAPDEPSGRGVYAFLVGVPEGMAMIDLEPEGLVLAMASWGSRNLLDPAPLLAQRMRLLGKEIERRGRPPENK